ncbi:hypothetical protein K438DRAFT_324602 [Mycena galopus ATCC 62051]|nr:hypothetical protein K438DRAFT_324602 [Mycena galopus ATCC 62051]
MVDSLYGNQAGRRGIRLGKFKHAHEISVEEDILDDFRNHTFSPELDNILQPHREILLSIFSKPWKDNKAIPAVEYILNSVKGKTIPYAGDLSLLEQAQIMNWFYNKIPLARGHLTEWVGLPPHAHAITIVIASRNERELRDNPNFPTDAPEAKQLQTLWDWAWCLQRTQCRVPVADVDRECLGLLEQWMFESSDAAGLAGDEQWGLDAGHHQDRWQPYIGLPAEWSSYRSGKEDDEKYRRGLNFSVDGLSGDEASAHKPLRSAHIQPKPRKRTVLVAVKA